MPTLTFQSQLYLSDKYTRRRLLTARQATDAETYQDRELKLEENESVAFTGMTSIFVRASHKVKIEIEDSDTNTVEFQSTYFHLSDLEDLTTITVTNEKIEDVTIRVVSATVASN